MEKQACVSHINQGLCMARVVSGPWLFGGPWPGFQCILKLCPFCLAQWGARWRLCSLKSSPRSCVRSDPSLESEVVGQGPAFVQFCILWSIVCRPQRFRVFKGSFAQFLLSATLSIKKQQCSGLSWCFSLTCLLLFVCLLINPYIPLTHKILYFFFGGGGACFSHGT